MTKMGNNRVLGELGEQNVRCDLSRKGYVVSTNDEGDKADFTVRKYNDDGNSRSDYFGTQTKYGGGEENTYTVVLKTVSGGQKNERTQAEYKVGDFEVFTIDFTENFGKVAYIPQCLVRAQEDKKLILRITPPINGERGTPFWSIWEFLSIEKSRLCKNGEGYRKWFSGENNDLDGKRLKMWEDLEKHIQYKWSQMQIGSPYNNDFVNKIELAENQYPKWLRANLIGNTIWNEYGEEPLVSPTEVRSSNAVSYIRKDLKEIPDPECMELLRQFTE